MLTGILVLFLVEDSLVATQIFFQTHNLCNYLINVRKVFRVLQVFNRQELILVLSVFIYMIFMTIVHSAHLVQ